MAANIAKVDFVNAIFGCSPISRLFGGMMADPARRLY
jgi:hypothetical protein